MIKKILNILFYMVLLGGIFFLSAFAKKEQNKNICIEVRIKIDRNDSDPLVDSENILNNMIRVFDTIEGKLMIDIGLDKIETYLNQINGIEKADVYTSFEGVLFINILQQKPLLRIINSNGISFYIDRHGQIFSTKLYSSAQVPVANGNIHLNPTGLSSDSTNTLIKKLFRFAKYLDENDFFSRQIEQIYVQTENEFELIPKIGNHYIIFGDTNNFNKKFRKLEEFYRDGITRTDGWKKYKSINLKFKDQIVCTKK